MKKRSILLISLLGLSLALSACGTPAVSQTAASVVPETTVQAAPASETATLINQGSLQNQNLPQTASYIGEEKAFEISLQHSGVSPADVVFSIARLDHDDGRYEYEVEFYAANKEYDYSIDAVSGAVLSFDFDMESHFTSPVQTQTPTADSNTPAAGTQTQAPAQTQTPAQPAAAVSIDTARQTALSRVPGATSDHIRIVTDYDDGRMEYEGKIIYNNMEYEFEIDAATGNITSWEAESIFD